MKIFLINLENRKDRFKSMNKQLNNLNLNYSRIDAIDGTKVSPPKNLFDNIRFLIEQGRECTAGEVGCAMSHIKIWQQIVDENIDYSLILEDDCLLSSKLPILLCSKEIYCNFDYLKIDGCGFFRSANKNEKTHPKHDLTKFKGLIMNKLEANGFTAFQCDPVPYSMVGYLISKKAAVNFLKVAKSMYYPIDLLPRYSLGMLKQGFLDSVITAHIDAHDSNINRQQNKSNIFRVAILKKP